MKKTMCAALCVAAVFGFTGCQQAPNMELEAAQAALQEADSVEADVYVADLYTAALDSFNAAEAEIEAQNAASGFSRDYGRASELLAYVVETAENAQDQVEIAKEEIRAETDSLIAVVQLAISAAPVQNQSVQTEDGSAPTAASLLKNAIRARERGDLKTAHDLVEAAADQLSVAAQTEATAPRS